ncbi:hypothetical protein L7F22_031900 [Adiantum nelumboides]|nr:hypothetical protein [Adiantum nelumboides]
MLQNLLDTQVQLTRKEAQCHELVKNKKKLKEQLKYEDSRYQRINASYNTIKNTLTALLENQEPAVAIASTSDSATLNTLNTLQEEIQQEKLQRQLLISGIMTQTAAHKAKVKELEQQLAQAKAKLEMQKQANETLSKEKEAVGSLDQSMQISTAKTHLHVHLPHMPDMLDMLGSSQHEEEGQGIAPKTLDVKDDITQTIEDMPEGPAKEFLLHEKRVMELAALAYLQPEEQVCAQRINIDDEMKAIFLLCLLPPSWDIFCTDVSNSAPNGTLVYIDVTSSLLSEEMRQKTMGSSHHGKAHYVQKMKNSVKLFFDFTLSRALADFFGEHSMLVVVCKTSEAAGLLVRLNESDGSIDDTCGLYDYIKRQKQNIHEKLRIFILENMRLYIEGLEESDLQKLLKLVQRKLIDGSVSRGFSGYAVNFVQLNEEHGGLRESPFYSLLKELQVYDTRRNLFSAKSALTAGGTSLDGSMVQERGCEDFGQWQKPKILFSLRSRNIHSGTIPPLRSINKITQINDALRNKKQRGARIRYHLLKIAGHGVGPCDQVPDAVKEVVTRLHADARGDGTDRNDYVNELVNAMGEEASQSVNDATASTHASDSSKSKKRKGYEANLGSAFHLQARKHADQALRRFFYAEDIPEWKVRSPFFLEMVKAIGQARPSYVPPSHHALRTTHLNDEVKCIKSDLMAA